MSKYRSHAEKTLAGIIRRNGIPLAYTGKASYWIRANGKSMNPDFINEHRKKIVEVFGGMGTIHTLEEAAQRISDYATKGWSAFIITDSEIYTDPEMTAMRLKEFCEIAKGETATPAKVSDRSPAAGSPLSS